jgi:hypothetical protein
MCTPIRATLGRRFVSAIMYFISAIKTADKQAIVPGQKPAPRFGLSKTLHNC